jgi:hypothetical protein
MPQHKSANHLLWGQCPLSKWHCQASHLGPLRKHTKATAPCACPLARGGPLPSVAICPAERHLPSQQPTSAGGWHMKVGAFQLNLSRQQFEACAHFGCPVFALQNVLASGSQLPRWSPCTHLGLNLGPSPMHTRNIYLILNLVKGCVSPQYHCHFNYFFEKTRHGAPDVSGTICWQQLANLDRAKTVLSKVSMPNQHSVMYSETPSDEEPHTMSNPIFEPNIFDTTSDNYSISEALQVSENSHTSQQN